MKHNTSSKKTQVFFGKLAATAALIAIGAIFFFGCEVVTNNVDGSSAGAALSVARAGVKVPVPISDQTGLANIESDTTGSYVLANDIVLTDWIPICDPNGAGAFTGKFDGAGHTIIIQSFDSTAATDSAYLGVFAASDDKAGFENVTVAFEFPAVNSEALQWFGGLVAFAQNSVFLNIRVTGMVDLTTNIPPPYARDVWKTVNGSRVLNVTAVNTDGLNVGGIVGYGNAVYLNNVAALKPIINATSKQTAVFIGGIAGFTDESTINAAQSTVIIDGDGPGYNTSAGGVGGYIVGTTVTNSSADARITLQALSTEFGWSDSWQIDAGGLIGYAGGSETTASYITRSSATGTVDAYAPFPYAGGFIGYVYGFNNFSDPARNGTTITESYATGNVTSTVQDNGVIGNIPYAGGFAGYSSVGDSRIVDSYARGNATATTTGTYGWAGGFIGGNANDSAIIRVYATGDVLSTTGTLAPLYAPDYADAGPAAGGIAGFNYYTKDTSVSSSVALNNTVRGNQSIAQDVVHRVAGSLGQAGHEGYLSNNLANAAMTVGDNWKPEYGLDRRDGLDTAAVPAQSVYAGLGWLFGSVWKIGSGGYPALQWQ